MNILFGTILLVALFVCIAGGVVAITNPDW